MPTQMQKKNRYRISQPLIKVWENFSLTNDGFLKKFKFILVYKKILIKN